MRTLTLMIAFLYCIRLAAQTTEVTVSVLDDKLHPLAGAKVEMVEIHSNDRLSQTTDSKGLANLTLSEGQSWMLQVNGFPYKQYIADVVDNGISTNSFTVVYNVALLTRLSQQVFKRQHLQLQQQQVNERDQPSVGYSKISIQVQDSLGIPKTGKQVYLANVKGGIRYAAVSNLQGFAHFLVPIKNNYDIDVEEVLNISHIDLDRKDQWVIETSVVYNEPAYREQDRNDTITQQIQQGVRFFGGRALTSVSMLRNDHRNIKNEPVYLQDVQTGKVYQASTNAEGKAYFVLPFESKYLISFRYQPNVDIINLMEIRGKATANFEITYTPLPELEYPERFLPTLREIKLFDPAAFNPASKTPLLVGKGQIFQAKQYPLPSLLQRNALLKWQLQLPPAENTRRLPYNIVFLLDKSGSMEADSNFYALKTYLKEALAGFSPGDQGAVIFYDTEKKVALPFQSFPVDHSPLYKAIDQVEAGGGTSIRSALEYAYQVLANAATPNRNNLLVIVSDGYDENNALELEALGKKYAHKSRCITMGVGQIYNRDFMQAVADKSNGKHYHVAQSKNFELVFHSLLQDLTLPVYENVTLHLEAPAQLTNLFGPGNKPIPVIGKKITIPLPNAVAGSIQSSFLSFSAPGGVNMAQVPARLSYRLKTPEGVRSFDVALENGTLAQEYTDAIDEYFISFVNTQLQEFAVSNSTNNFGQSRKSIDVIMKALKIWEKENKAITTNEHYMWLKKTILQYERALSAAEKKK
ncbi:VWA domain-containing protein [Chitinophagaceae bacterium LB-8]|uniref:VWA domain-containing protein n=1 Tax=Paraflavisolibacter caeni TaxID=2982496 RepID=A0A9X3B8Y1_9BACT|nr:VWA domain-containing protein [Paraflavisolibacter caeni]MCU7551405.1 VWA domain-containing protein [Paraflavisolibacter caeni]